MAIKIEGPWKKGYALDLHTLSSEYLGDNEFGHPRFDTKRTEIGELVYKLKYNNDKSAIKIIIQKIKECISGIDKFDIIIPVPPSNIYRNRQPVFDIGEALSKEFNISFVKNAIRKSKTTEEMKNVIEKEKRMKILQDAIELTKKIELKKKKVLLIDDLYRSGATLSVVTNILYELGKVREVCVLTLTKTRSNR